MLRRCQSHPCLLDRGADGEGHRGSMWRGESRLWLQVAPPSSRPGERGIQLGSVYLSTEFHQPHPPSSLRSSFVPPLQNLDSFLELYSLLWCESNGTNVPASPAEKPLHHWLLGSLPGSGVHRTSPTAGPECCCSAEQRTGGGEGPGLLTEGPRW